jgi:hypothetical protein
VTVPEARACRMSGSSRTLRFSDGVMPVPGPVDVCLVMMMAAYEPSAATHLLAEATGTAVVLLNPAAAFTASSTAVGDAPLKVHDSF